MDLMLDFMELEDPAMEAFNFKEKLISLKETIINFVKEKLEFLMTLKRKISSKFSKTIYMEKRNAEEFEELINARYEDVDNIDTISKEINAIKNGVAITNDTMTAQEIAAEINQGTNKMKNIIQNDDNFVEESNNANPVTRQKVSIRAFACSKIKGLIDKISEVLTNFSNTVSKFFSKNSPDSDEVESQHKPRLIRALSMTLSAAVAFVAVFLTSKHLLTA